MFMKKRITRNFLCAKVIAGFERWGVYTSMIHFRSPVLAWWQLDQEGTYMNICTKLEGQNTDNGE